MKTVTIDHDHSTTTVCNKTKQNNSLFLYVSLLNFFGLFSFLDHWIKMENKNEWNEMNQRTRKNKWENKTWTAPESFIYIYDDMVRRHIWQFLNHYIHYSFFPSYDTESIVKLTNILSLSIYRCNPGTTYICYTITKKKDRIFWWMKISFQKKQEKDSLTI